MRGSITPSGSGTLRMRVATALPRASATVAGRPVRSTRDGRFVSFAMPVRAGHRTAWAIRGR